jgi:putative transposase
MDFMSDALESGRCIRVFNIIDDFNRGGQAALSFPAERLIKALKEIRRDRGKFSSIRCENGSEFISYTLKDWAEQFQIHLDYIQPREPNQTENQIKMATSNS